VIDVTAGSLTVAVDGFEAVAGAVLDTCGVVIVAVIRTRAGRPSSANPASTPARRKRPTCGRLGAMNAMWTRRVIGCWSSVCVSAKFPQTEKLGLLAVCSISS
jgi:hypothetical protein